jgi:hypothetical protein
MRKALVKRGDKIVEVTIDENTYKTGGSNLIKRKDGSYSQRGLWDNIRANKGSGKKPTKQMLDQAKKITRNKKQTGGEEMYVPDTGIEQYAPDQSWYEGNPNASAPGNVVSWPSYPIQNSGVSRTQLPRVENEVPQNIAQSSSNSTNINSGLYPRNPRIYMDRPRYLNQEFEPNRNSRLSQWFNNLAGNVGQGFENFGDFIGNIEMPKRKRRGFLKKLFRGKGKGLLNCKPGTACTFQEGGEENQFEELLDQIEDALEQGANPQELFQQLIQMGVDENSAKKIIQTAIQKIQGEGEENEDEESNRMMAYGGSADPCPPNYYWDEDEGMCVPMSQGLPSRDDLYNNPEMQKDLDRLNYKRNIQQYKIDYNNNKNKFYQDNYKGPKIKDEKGRVLPDYNSPEYKDFKILYDEYLKTLPNPDRSSFKLPTDYQKKNFYPKEGEWDEDSKKEFNRFFNPEPTQQEKEEGILKEYLKSKPQVNPDFYYNDIPADDPVQQYKMNQDQLRDYRYEEEWCPCYKMKEELIAGRPVMKKICVPCEQAKMGGNLDKFMQKGGDKKQLSSSVKTASNSDVLNQTRNIITNTGSNNDITDTENFSRITNNYPDKASDTSYMYMYNSATDPSKGINFFYNTSIDPDTGNPIINFNNGQSITPEQEAYYKQLIAAGLNIPYDFKEGGSYRVYKTSERKGKTHKVVGPGGVTKYFGDPKLGERSKSKYGKKGFYARHKKNLAKNPFFRAYARATWAEGGEPSYMNEPEYKTNSFISKVKEMGQMERDKSLYDNIMEQSQQMLMQMGGSSDNYGYVGNPQFDMYQQAFDEFNSKGNAEAAALKFANKAGMALEGLIEKAAVAVTGQPAAGKGVKAIFDMKRPKSFTDPTSKGLSGLDSNALQALKSTGFDPSTLSGSEGVTSFMKIGGAMRRFQTGAEFTPPTLSDIDWGEDISSENDLIPNVPGEGLDVIENWRKAMEKQSAIVGDNKNWDPLTFSNRDIKKYNLNPISNNINPPVKKDNNKSNLLSWLPATADLLTAFGNRGKAKKLEAQMADMTASDNVFASGDTSEGKFQINTGKLIDGYVLGSNQAVPALSSAKYGGIQKPGVYMSYPTATPESVVYGKPDKKMSNTLGPVDRDKANLEAEGGETVMTPAGDDGIPKFFKIGGKRHSEGGTPLYLPENSFIFSDTRSMLLGKNMLEEFGITGKKKKTPAEVAKILGKGYEKYVKIIQDPNSDSIERRTAEMMIQTQINNLGKLALAQESKKGFPQGIPMISVPYMASIGVSAEQVLPQQPQMPEGMPQGNMMPPEMMQQMQMQQMPMAQVGTQIDKNIAQKIFSGENPITNQKYFKPPAKSVWEQYPEAYSIFQSANQSRNIDDITKAETYLNEIDVPWSIGIPGTDQDIIENAANTLRDRAIMLKSDYEKAKKKYENEQSANKLFSLREQLINIKKGIPKTAENIDKIKELDSAIQDMSVFSPSKKDYFWSTPGTNSLIAKYSELVKKYGKVNKETPVVSESSNLLNTAAPEQQDTVPVQTAPVITPSQSSKQTKSVSKTDSSKPSKQTVTMDFFKDVKFENQ